ncbi:MAG: penicillin-binding protein 2 [Meiothermus sp.]|uniref:peptidoglycan D,D-transpeptidase FtsI family protein n=1 Tax=Meiothermus sp. TaxID=1955249 RepID=UPI0025D44750|nr:penicillin-binding protein 2 [Meiothermus sp.]MCS7068240.1 penicillin-binding protein 2 [Meiothermus sp.]MDW8425023.1 penicillin-binding protein 2 [Meiothermus sp.]
MNPLSVRGQAALSRGWVVVLAFFAFLLGLGYGFYVLWHNAPSLPLRPASALVEGPPLRGSLEAADGTPLVFSTPEETRLYPLGLSATQLIGFGERSSGKGLSGLELDLEKLLSEGHSLRLTIDPQTQAIAEQALWRGLEAAQADWGTVVVMESKTGRLLAVANGPAFDPTAPRRSSQQDPSWRNHAFAYALEPGSTIKPLTAAVLLEENMARLDTRVYAPMSRRIAGWTINDVVKHPETLTLSEVLKFSSNVGITTLAERIPRETLYSFFKKMHFMDKELLPPLSYQPRIAVQVAAPQVRPVHRWGPAEYANATFGQGFLITPLHLAAAYNILAGDGVYRQPILFEGNTSQSAAVFRPQVARDIRKALTEGIAEKARLPGYVLGGKTGTAQVVVNGRYSQSVYAALFAGFIPANAPRVTVVVTLFHPKGERIHGSQVAAPIYREIAARLLALWGVPPQLDNSSSKGKLVKR